MTNNKMVLARMIAQGVVENARRGPDPTPFDQLMAAVEGAIADARDRRDALVAAGEAGSQSYLKTNAQIARWEAARRVNR